MKKKSKGICTIYRGVPASPGVVIGKVFLLNRESIEVTEERIPDNEVSKEILRFKKAINDTREELLVTREKVAKRIDPDHARIFDAQIMILEDELINNAVIEKIKQTHGNAEFVYRKVIGETVKTLSTTKDE